MRSTTIFSGHGRVLAVIDYHLTGDTVLRGRNEAVHGYYDADEDYTSDVFNRILARGNQTAQLVSPLCLWATAA